MPNLRSIIIVFWSIFWSIIGAVGAFLDPSGKFYSFLARDIWSPSVLWIGGIKVETKGKENIDVEQPYVVVANHESQIDIPVLFSGLPIGMRFLAKRSLFFIPFFGWSMAVAGYIPIDRSSRRKAVRSIDKAALRIRKGPSLMVFPEGTRSPDGGLKKFKTGAFVLAIKAGIPVLPVAIRGTFEVMPKSSLAIRPGNVECVIGRPIETKGMAMTNKEALKNQAFAAVAEMIENGVQNSKATSVD